MEGIFRIFTAYNSKVTLSVVPQVLYMGNQKSLLLKLNIKVDGLPANMNVIEKTDSCHVTISHNANVILNKRIEIDFTKSKSYNFEAEFNLTNRYAELNLFEGKIQLEKLNLTEFVRDSIMIDASN